MSTCLAPTCSMPCCSPRKLLAKHTGGTKQIIMISDGEPTAHLENGQAQFAYPATPETIRATFKAVKHCTTRGIAINTFMLDSPTTT